MPALKYLETLSSEEREELHTYTKAIVCRLRYERKRRNLSKLTVAKETGISGYQTIEMEGKKDSFSFPLLYRLATYYGITVEDLIDKNNIHLNSSE